MNPPPPPSTPCRAVIDIGTNSVKLLVARVRAGTIEPLWEMGLQTRLGEGFFQSGRLQPAPLARTAEAIARLRDEAFARGCPPAQLRVIATAAAREALNTDELRAAVRAAAGLELDVISGAVEAEMAFRGVCSQDRYAAAALLVTDVGGGSTEFILGRAGVRQFSRSYPLGTVRLLEQVRPPEAPDAADLARCRQAVGDFLTAHVRDAVLAIRPRPDDGAVEFLGVGGTALILARIHAGLDDYDRVRIEDTVLSADTLTALCERLWGTPLPERRRIRGLPPERADIILTGVAIYEGIVRVLGLPSMRPSTRGLRFAALLDPAPA